MSLQALHPFLTSSFFSLSPLLLHTALHPSPTASPLKHTRPTRESQSQVSGLPLFHAQGGWALKSSGPSGDWEQSYPAGAYGALRAGMGTDGVALGWGQGADAATPEASAALLSRHCLPVAPAHPLPGRPSVISPWHLSASSPTPNSRGSSREGLPRFPCSGGKQEGGGHGVAEREGTWLERPGTGVSESINHAPLRSCLTHVSDELSVKPLIN